MIDLNSPDALDDWLAEVADLNPEDPADWDSISAPPNIIRPADPNKWRRYNPGQILTSEPPEVQWVCKDLQLGPGRPAVLVGAAGAGKNDTAQALALSVATGLPAFGRWPVARGRVLHLTYDMGFQGCQLRYRRLCNGMGIELADLAPDRLSLCVHPRLNLVTEKLDDKPIDIRNELIELIRDEARSDEPFCFLILDNLRSACPGIDENDSAISKYVELLGAVGERTGCTILYLHHTPQSSPARARGSGAIVAASGTVWAIEGSLDAPRHLSMQRMHDCATDSAPDFWLQRRLVASGSHAVREGSSWALEALDAEPEPPGGALGEKILRVLARSKAPLTQSNLREKCGGPNLERLKEAINGLVAVGKLQKAGENYALAL